MYKIVVSFTTSPSRIYRIEPVIKAVLSQDYEIQSLEINLPDKYKNKEEYILPDFLKTDDFGKCLKYPKVSVIRTGRDIGPSSKVIPTLIRYKDDPEVFVVSIDDDHIYPNNIVTTLVTGLHVYGDKNVYGIGGLDLFVGPNMSITMGGYHQNYKVATIEGVFGVLYNPRIIANNIEEINTYYDTIMKCSECITSDDITISNYLAMKNVPIMRLNMKNMNRKRLKGMLDGIVIKESNKDSNAIHMLPGGHGKRYFLACLYLKENSILHLKIQKGSKFR